MCVVLHGKLTLCSEFIPLIEVHNVILVTFNQCQQLYNTLNSSQPLLEEALATNTDTIPQNIFHE